MESHDYKMMFYAKENYILECPVQGCNHRASILTKFHFRNEHGIERHEVVKKYGKPKPVNVQRKKVSVDV